jgi:phospholipase C
LDDDVVTSAVAAGSTNPPDQVVQAIRLGWLIAEARGRYRLGDSPRLAPVVGLPSRIGHALPLADERSPAEQRIEVEHVLGAVAGGAGVDPPDYRQLPGQSGTPSGAGDGAKAASMRLGELAVDLRDARTSGDTARISHAWDSLAELLYGWDAYIQDRLAALPFGTASAYQLGRSLAEMYWALDPTAPAGDPSSWQFLWGEHRGQSINHLLDRLAGHFSPLTTHALRFGVKEWSELAADAAWRCQTNVMEALRRQVRLWQDLLVTGEDPATLVAPRTLLKRARQIRGLVASFWPELMLLVVALAILLGAVAFLSGRGTNQAGATVGLVGGSLGMTGAGLAARAKNLANNVFGRLRTTLDQDVVDAAVTLRPPRTPLPKVAPGQAAIGGPPIEHVIVLALENRSFDHLLGFLDHPNLSFDGLTRGGPYTNPRWGGGPQVAATPDAKVVLPVDPDHSHDAVMEQLSLQDVGRSKQPTNQGFVTSYERKGRGLATATFGGLLGLIANWWVRRKSSQPPPVEHRGPLVMGCQPSEHTPVLSTLAREFGVCTRWFCSVPGETWPNRNFLHAATSDGETNIALRFYRNRTIFELLEGVGKTWAIYHDDTPQIWAFRRLWETDERHSNWFDFGAFADHVAAGQLATYSFIEPNHRPPLHTLDHAPVVGDPAVSNSQHPGNNLVSNDAYDSAPANPPSDFDRAEALIASVYETLRAKPEIFERSILLVTYDEHGGLYDHVAPPSGVPNPGLLRSRMVWLLKQVFFRRGKHFDFTMLGPRVPAVVISPYVRAGTISTEVRDHASVPATVRTLFAPNAKPLTRRDAWARPFHTLLTLSTPRQDLPDLSATPSPPSPGPSPAADAAAGTSPVPPDYYADFVKLSNRVGKRLAKRGVSKARDAQQLVGPAKAVGVTEAFKEAAQQTRQAKDARG